MERFQSHGVSFLLKERFFSLKSFWDKLLLLDYRQTKHDTLVNSTLLLKFMRDEYVEVVDEVASQCVTDQKCYDQVLEVLSARGIQTCADAQNSLDDSKPSAIDLKEAASMKEAAPAMLLQEGDSGSEKVIVKMDFDEGSPNRATTAQSDKPAMAVTGELKRKRTETDTICLAGGDSCRLLDVDVVCQGKRQNGSACCKCEEGTFHHVCLFVFEGYMNCSNCYKMDVWCPSVLWRPC